MSSFKGWVGCLAGDDFGDLLQAYVFVQFVGIMLENEFDHVLICHKCNEEVESLQQILMKGKCDEKVKQL